MTLGGFALAVGMLVDEATVAIENIHTHLARGCKTHPAAQMRTRSGDEGLAINRVKNIALHRPPARRFLRIPQVKADAFSCDHE